MKTIWKFPLQTTDEQIVHLPPSAEIFTAQACRGEVCIWAIVESGTLPDVPRKILIYGTGHPVKDVPQRYIGTVQLEGGALVFHVFEALA